jgi:hypothetical protein
LSDGLCHHLDLEILLESGATHFAPDPTLLVTSEVLAAIDDNRSRTQSPSDTFRAFVISPPIFNPSPICRVCTSLELRWEQSRGEGNIYSWTVAWRPQHPSFVVPYAPIIVDLQEGYQMLSILVGCEIKRAQGGPAGGSGFLRRR